MEAHGLSEQVISRHQPNHRPTCWELWQEQRQAGRLDPARQRMTGAVRWVQHIALVRLSVPYTATSKEKTERWEVQLYVIIEMFSTKLLGVTRHVERHFAFKKV